MRYDFECERLVALPIQDYSELEELLEQHELHGWELVSTFESFAAYEDDLNHHHQGIYLFGIFKMAEGWPSNKLL